MAGYLMSERGRPAEVARFFAIAAILLVCIAGTASAQVPAGGPGSAPGDFQLRLAGRTLRTERTDLPTSPTQGVSTNGRVLLLVQFEGPTQPSWIRALESSGVRGVQPVQPFALLVDAPVAARASIPKSEGVRWTGDYTTDLRLHPHMNAVVRSAANTTDEDTDPEEEIAGAVNIQIARMEKKPEETFREKISRLGGAVIAMQQVGGLDHARVYLPTDKIPEAARLAEVVWIEPMPRNVRVLPGRAAPGPARD